MCFHSKLSLPKKKLEQQFHKKFITAEKYSLGNLNGFQFPKTPIINNSNTNHFEIMQWGLIPHWAKDQNIRQYTLNARIETLNEKPSFKDYLTQRCLIIFDGFYEWQWLDKKGKQKQKYYIQTSDSPTLVMGGLYSTWQNPATNSNLKTYTIVTKPANTLMAEIHNTKKRMPLILNTKNQEAWLSQEELQYFETIENNNLEATPIFSPGQQFNLF